MASFIQPVCSHRCSLHLALVQPARGNQCLRQPRPAFSSQKLSSSASIAPAFSLSHSCPRVARRSGSQGTLNVRSEISYIMVKPDGVQRGLVGEIIGRLERKGFKLKALQMRMCTREIAEEHYKDLKQKPFFKDLVDYILSGPVVAMVWEGNGVVASARKLIGATNPLNAEPGTIRGDLCIQTGRNIVHGSDSPENGERETGLWFEGDATVEWSQTIQPWLTE